MRTGCRETMRERGSKGAGADGVCPCTMYDVRCTIWEVRAHCAVVMPVSQLEKFVRAAQIFFDTYKR